MVRRCHSHWTHRRRTPIPQTPPSQSHVFYLHQRFLPPQPTKVLPQHVRFCWKMPRKRPQKKVVNQKVTPASLHHPNRIRRQRKINLRRHGQKQKGRQLVSAYVRTALNQVYFYHLGLYTLLKMQGHTFLCINNLLSKIGESFDV